MNTTQLTLTLIEDPDGEPRPVWSIDERTREIGRRRVAEARALLRRHAPAEDPHHQPHAA